MGKLLRNIVGLVFVAASIVMAGADRQSQQLSCQKVAPQVANCRAAIKTLAGWGGRVEDFADVRSAQVASAQATKISWAKGTPYSGKQKPTGEVYYNSSTTASARSFSASVLISFGLMTCMSAMI